MTIRTPETAFNQSDKELLALLARLLLENIGEPFPGANSPHDAVRLSDGEADRLAALLERLVDDPGFQRRAYFVEAMTDRNERNALHVRELYLSERKRRGRVRALSSIKWAEFKARLGLGPAEHPYAAVPPMDYEHFMAMENKLLTAAGIHPRVVDLVLANARAQEIRVERVVRGSSVIPHGFVRRHIVQPLLDASRYHDLAFRSASLSRGQITAAVTLIADFSVIFTTRDWDVAGTLSGMAAAATALSESD
ncbi:hypothetical protein [Phenylobacterium sp. J367]|uniref:hypothetical protein n=1 Tax=Phenylobacterium sp. J367 TaxID=2898435 RepID=UPI00215075DD|nr:hypothetical protein [Phenylobacterium sp. J367]MCR5877103.1 hypothetical protein [Phenylobacterium sp. J367]